MLSLEDRWGTHATSSIDLISLTDSVILPDWEQLRHMGAMISVKLEIYPVLVVTVKGVMINHHYNTPILHDMSY